MAPAPKPYHAGMRDWVLGMLLIACSTGCSSSTKANDPLFAAASLEGPLTTHFNAVVSMPLRCHFAGSSTLARQIANGARASVLISAHPRWIDYLDGQGLVRARSSWIANRLVLVARADSDWHWAPGQPLAAVLPGRLALGDPQHVPAGIYAKQVWESEWPQLVEHVVPTQDVRAALRCVQHGAAEAAVVYRSDLQDITDLRTVALIPIECHEPIRYAIALIGDSEAAQCLYDYLCSDAVRGRFIAAGFDDA